MCDHRSMAYLRLQDYLRFIPQQQLDEITDENPFTREDLEPTSEEEAISYLVQKYDTKREFAGVSVYDITKSYKALSLVYLDGPEWSDTADYSDELVLASDFQVYQANDPITGEDPVISTTGNWILL